MTSGRTALPSTWTFGSQPSQRGRYQLRSPSSAIADGTRIERTIVASRRTATPRPKPICWRKVRLAGREAAEDGDHDQGRAGDDPAPSRCRPTATDSALSLGQVVVLLDPAEQEDVVVHREAEEDREEEERQPGLDRLDLLEAEEVRPGALPGRPRRAARRRRRPRAGSSRSPWPRSTSERKTTSRSRKLSPRTKAKTIGV